MRRAALEELRPGGVRDRLPDARQRRARPRTSCRRRSCACTARSSERRADRVAARLPLDGRHAAGDRPAALGPGRGARRYVGEWLPEPLLVDEDDDPAAPRRDGRLAVARLPRRCSRASRPSSARCSCCATCSTTPTTRIAEIVGKSEAERAPARGPGAPPRRRAPAALRGLARAARRARRPLLRGRSRTATSRRSRRCSPTTSCCHGDGGGKAPALARALHGRARVARTARRLGCARSRRVGGVTDAPRARSTASRARCSSTPTAG